MSEHEAIQPPAKFIRHPKNYDPCPKCGTLKAKSCKQCWACRCKRPEIQQPDDPSIRYIPLTRGQYAIVDAHLYRWLMRWNWYAMKVRGKNKYYAVRAVPYPADKSRKRGGKHCPQTCLFMHRFTLGVTDPAIEVDHKIPDTTLNNTLGNLRLSTASQNGANRLKCRGVSIFKGVHIIRIRGKAYWRAGITVNGIFKALGIHVQELDAAIAYDVAAIKEFGEFAQTNLPREHYE